MTTPPDPKSLDEALSILQADPPVLTKNKDGQVGNQKTKYADLVQVNAVVLSRLNALGVVYKTKPTLREEEPKFVLRYSLKHVPSGEEETGDYPLKLSDNPMQMGSAITYARRYVLLAITGIAAEDEDDDGQAAAGHRSAQRATQQRQRQAPADSQTAQRQQRQARPAPAAPPPLPGETAGITEPQRKHIFALLGERGITERNQRLAGISKVVGRQITSTNELTTVEAATVIDSLEPAPEVA